MNGAGGIDVLGIGVVAVDDLLYVDAYPPAESKINVRRRERQCGGLTGRALVAAARLGARCGYAGSLGPDSLSALVAEHLAREGIDLTHAVRRPDARPYHSTVVVSLADGSRTIFAWCEGHCGADAERPEAEVLRAARVLLVDHHQMPGTIRAARIARERGVAVVADFERDPGEGFREVLPLVDHLVLPERFALDLSGQPTAAGAVESLWSEGSSAVVVTCGSRGCWYADAATSRAPRHQPAFAVDATDTTGCGDVFHGAYAAALAEGRPLADRVRWAAAAAALKASGHGGQAGIPNRAAVESLLAAHPRR